MQFFIRDDEGSFLAICCQFCGQGGVTRFGFFVQEILDIANGDDHWLICFFLLLFGGDTCLFLLGKAQPFLLDLTGNPAKCEVVGE